MEVVGARQETSSGIVKGEKDVSSGGVVAVSVGLRAHDAFSLSPITVSASVVVSTRAEMDETGLMHEQAREAVTNLLSRWHRYGEEMQTALETERFHAGELRMDGGTGKQFDQTRSAWVESVTFSIRGAERFYNNSKEG